jgi:hypothetical protein
MRLTQNEHHRKLRALIGDISDWYMNADISGFAAPYHANEWLQMYSIEDSFTFVPPCYWTCQVRLSRVYY